jgi:hypothetical protein
MKVQSAGHALQLDGSDAGQRHRCSVGRVHDFLAHQHLAWSGVLGDPGRDIHGPAVVVTLLEDDRTGVDPEPQPCNPGTLILWSGPDVEDWGGPDVEDVAQPTGTFVPVYALLGG